MAASEHSCTARTPGCTYAALCERCYGRELAGKRPQARVIGACWGERVCRGERRARATWPTEEPKTLAIARRLVAQLAGDPRLLEALALACSQGAEAWWVARPAKYRL